MASVNVEVETSRPTWRQPLVPSVPTGYDPLMTMQADSPPYPGETVAPYEAARKLREMPGDGTVAKLPPGPRAQNIVDPSQTRQFSTDLQDRYSRGDQYIVASPTQNIVGMVEGGTDNSNWVRGNNFANEYNYNRIHNRPAVQMKDLPKPPKTIANVIPSPFYPYPSFNNREDMNYKTFPSESSASYYDFLPFYTYPYRTINNKDRMPTEKPEMSKQQLASGAGSGEAMTREHFDNQMAMSPTFVSGFLIIMILMGSLLILKR